jgi:hypothetical protein
MTDWLGWMPVMLRFLAVVWSVALNATHILLS